ncbi:MAG: NUDIX hydrolase [Anaerolineales bacterium]|jgi:ADP-ribose pyrophosphatase YjhB (NUDIX family)
MKAEYTDVLFLDGQEIPGTRKEVDLPFRRISARAMIVRRSDGAILGTLHRQGGQYALPGGALEDGESTLETARRELAEEKISLIAPEWMQDVAVDFYSGYCELSVWHLVVVEDAQIGDTEENIESRWIKQDEDVWYPSMHENLILALNRFLPELAKASTSVTAL